MSATGDLLLGINAHVQRDLPLVLYAAGLVRPDGTSRKSDHDRVNVILNRVTDDVLAEIARRFDPTVDDTNLPTSLDEATLFQLLAAWREKAWRNAELLAAAPTPAARGLIVAAIEARRCDGGTCHRLVNPLRPAFGRERYARQLLCCSPRGLSLCHEADRLVVCGVSIV